MILTQNLPAERGQCQKRIHCVPKIDINCVFMTCHNRRWHDTNHIQYFSTITLMVER